MQKKIIIKSLIDAVIKELDSIKLAAQTTKDHRQSDDLRSEGKYDTRSIEAGYLAVGQMQRLEELKLELQMLEEIPCRDFPPTDQIGIGALVEIEFNNQSRHYFISPTAGGTMLRIGDETVLVISVFSPIGNQVIDLKKCDTFELQTPKELRTYLIRNVS